MQSYQKNFFSTMRDSDVHFFSQYDFKIMIPTKRILNLNICRTPHLGELIFWLTQMIQNARTSEQKYDETLFLFKLFNVEHFAKKFSNRQVSFIF